MFNFLIVTLFPELFSEFVKTSLIGKAVENELLSFEFISLRDFTTDRHRTVDDTPYGGGPGMVMKPEPILKAFATLPDNTHKIFLTPQGKPFQQSDAARYAAFDKPLLLFCGRYEGVDERIVETFDEQLSLGDFVLNGGEVAAMAVVEAISRLIPGVIGKIDSTVEESFSAGLLEYPQYTRPEEVNGKSVPQVLLSGNHKKIEEWRKGQSLLRTYQVRRDLFEQYPLSEHERNLFAEALKGIAEK
ncbi:MAG: tRNA (guanosine(37)-N1)-methyltransferase TrmD [Deltaproteobacteria bacterium]|nr:tRNA (guanosine(37)-N1)-methyltransferase TrmD [Deltaproteobacteria bacterium]MBN2670415.1 tRNA (guanosine(37)-N1)-methyltransferase TrmD [Deltaproteobacteria bacterium]